MNVRKINLALWTATAALAAAALIGAGVGILAPVDVSVDQPVAARTTGPATSQASPDAQLSLESFAPVWALALRKPLSDSPGATSNNAETENPATVVDPSGAPFALVGTIGDSLAMIRTGAGVVEIKAVGEQANGAKILAIRPMQVDVEFGGARLTVIKRREGSGN
jgi:hypothetical protein